MIVFLLECDKNNDVEKIKLTWLDIAVIAFIVISFVFVFIPLSPSENGPISLFTYLGTQVEANNGARLIPFIFYVLLAFGSIILLVINQRSFFKCGLFAAAIFMFLLCYADAPTRLFSSLVASAYLVVDVAIIIFDFIKNRVVAKKNKQDPQ